MRQTDLVSLTVELADGSTDTITATGTHPFWAESGEELASRPLALEHAGEDDGRYVSSTGGRWVEARHLRLSDRLLSRFSASATVVGLRIRTERERVYYLTV